MSIPKNPRQLMINIMYLVLTAMLALNVSAEVMNAFFDINDSLEGSSKIADDATVETKKGLEGILEKKPKLREPINTGIDQTKSKVDAFVAKIEQLKELIVDASGNNNGTLDDGDYIVKDNHKVPRGKKNKDVTTRLLVGLDGKKGAGHALEGDIKTLRQELVEVYRNVLNDKNIKEEQGFNLKPELIDEKLATLESSLLLGIDENWKEKASSKKNSWAAYKFQQMPVAAALPILTKLQTDARNAQATIANKIAELAGGKEIKFDKFFPVIKAKRGYVIKGEKFEADVSLGAYSSDIKGVNITVNGRRINLGADGSGKFVETANSYGKRTLNLKATVTNPITGKVTSGSTTYEYEVGERSATVTATKMNVFYIGVDNPVEVAVAGASSNDVRVSCAGAGCSITGSNGKYNVRVSAPGTAKVTVNASGFSKSFEFRAKRIPDPVAQLGKEKGGAIGNGTFKAQQGLIAKLNNFDFDAKCKIQGFQLVRVPKREDAVQATNVGGRFTSEAKRLVSQAKPSDTYYFENVRAKCPGDKATRKINDMIFKIR